MCILLDIYITIEQLPSFAQYRQQCTSNNLQKKVVIFFNLYKFVFFR